MEKKPLISANASPLARLAQRTQDTGEQALKEAKMMDISRIEPDRDQPRRYFSERGMQELIEDVKVRGILQPPIVRPVGDSYRIVVGERRYRAAKAAGLTHIPVLVQDLTEAEARIISLVENIQREDLSFEDEANYFGILNRDYGYSIRQIAELVNKSKRYVDARLTLLKRPDIMAQVQEEKLGLHEATLLARMGISYNESDERSEKGVREKDTKNVQEKSVREKDKYDAIVRPYRQTIDFTKNIRKKVERYSEDEKATMLRVLDELEEELHSLRERLNYGRGEI